MTRAENMITSHFWDSTSTSLGFLRPSATKLSQPCDDLDLNDDYNKEQAQRDLYLKPYIYVNNVILIRIIRENMIFETVSSVDKSKKMRFQVLEVEVMDDEDPLWRVLLHFPLRRARS